MFTPRKLLTRFPILLPQIKAGKISYNLKNDTKKYCILYINIKKSPKSLQFNQVIIIMEKNMIAVRDPQNFALILIALKMWMRIFAVLNYI